MIAQAVPERLPPGRSRLCRVCGDWHSMAQPWPHNCGSERPPRAALSAPMIGPAFESFRTGQREGAVTIGSRAEKLDFMARHDLVEYDDGVMPDVDQSDRAWREELVADVKRSMETDPLNVPPVEIIGQTEPDGSPEIDTSTIEVFK